MLTSSTLIYLLVAAGGYLVRHWDVMTKLLGMIGMQNPLHAPDLVTNPKMAATAGHPLLSMLKEIATKAGEAAASAAIAKAKAEVDAKLNPPPK